MERAIAPDAVRVWRGFRSPSLTTESFYAKLGTVLIPATVRMQIDAGFTAYCPTALAGLTNRPSSVPDETAVLFCRSPGTCRQGVEPLAVRTYNLTHCGVFAPGSRAEFAVVLAGALTASQPVYLVEKLADWMSREVHHFAASRRAAETPVAFRKSVASALGDIEVRAPLNGAIACVRDDAGVYSELAARTALSGVASLESIVDWQRAFVAPPTDRPIGLSAPGAA